MKERLPFFLLSPARGRGGEREAVKDALARPPRHQPRGALCCRPDGEIEKLAGPEAAMRAAKTFPLVVHGPGDGGAAGARLAGGARPAGALRLRAAGDLLPARRCAASARRFDLSCDDELARAA